MPSLAAGDFLLDLRRAAVAFGLIVGEGHIRIAEKAKDVLFAGCKTRDEIVSGPGRLGGAMLAALGRGGRKRLMPPRGFGATALVPCWKRVPEKISPA
jgi:hypothetical protein